MYDEDKIREVIYSCKTEGHKTTCKNWLNDLLYKDLIPTRDYVVYLGVLYGKANNKHEYLQSTRQDK